MPPRTPPVRLDPPPPHKPTRFAKLHARVWAALKSAGLEVTGWEFSVFGGGDPDAPLSGYCPVCRRGIVAVWLLDDPPRIRLDEGCSAGCAPDEIVRAMR